MMKTTIREVGVPGKIEIGCDLINFLYKNYVSESQDQLNAKCAHIFKICVFQWSTLLRSFALITAGILYIIKHM
jgi:hypothetical protein